MDISELGDACVPDVVNSLKASGSEFLRYPRANAFDAG
jgi:hypothetical protein